MKEYILEPKTKKSVIEWTTFKRDYNGKTLWLRKELGWRGGSFSLYVPETEEEIQEAVKDRGYETLEEMLEDYGTDNIESIFLPDPEDDSVMVFEDYNADMIETWDGCWEYWTIEYYGEDGPTEEEKEAMIEEVEEAYAEEYESGVEALGWEEVDTDFEVTNGFTLTLVEDTEE